jgi:hypothetical protein
MSARLMDRIIIAILRREAILIAFLNRLTIDFLEKNVMKANIFAIMDLSVLILGARQKVKTAPRTMNVKSASSATAHIASHKTTHYHAATTPTAQTTTAATGAQVR